MKILGLLFHINTCLSRNILIYNLTLIRGFPCGSAGKESACNEGDLGSTPGLGRCAGEGKGYRLQYSGLEKPMDCIVHGVAESDTTERPSLSLYPCHLAFISINHILTLRPYVITLRHVCAFFLKKVIIFSIFKLFVT